MSEKFSHESQFFYYWLVTFSKLLNFSLNFSFLVCKMKNIIKQSIAQRLTHNEHSISANYYCCCYFHIVIGKVQ